jgi:hypothetical protein
MNISLKNSYPIPNSCPLHLNPYDNCYCVTLSIQDIEKAVHYCTANYPACPIFKAGSCGTEAAESFSSEGVFKPSKINYDLMHQQTGNYK